MLGAACPVLGILISDDFCTGMYSTSDFRDNSGSVNTCFGYSSDSVMYFMGTRISQCTPTCSSISTWVEDKFSRGALGAMGIYCLGGDDCILLINHATDSV